MRFIAGVMIWLSLGLTIALLAVTSVYTWMKYDDLKGEPAADGSIWNVNPMTQVTSSFFLVLQNFLNYLPPFSGFRGLPPVERYMAGALHHQCQLVRHHPPHHHLPPKEAQDCHSPHLGGFQGGGKHHEQRLLPRLLLLAAAGGDGLVGCRLHLPSLLHGEAVHSKVSAWCNMS